MREKTLAKETGGLSGRPLFDLSTQLLAQAYVRVEKQFPLIGIGGIDSPARAMAKIDAGATLIELYSALVFKGPGLIRAIKDGIVARLAEGNQATRGLCRHKSGGLGGGKNLRRRLV